MGAAGGEDLCCQWHDQGGRARVRRRYTAGEALKRAENYWRRGCSDIRIAIGDDGFTLEQFGSLAE